MNELPHEEDHAILSEFGVLDAEIPAVYPPSSIRVGHHDSVPDSGKKSPSYRLLDELTVRPHAA